MAALPYADPTDAIRSALQCGTRQCSCLRGPNVHCPVHDDRDPSFTVHTDNGRPLVHCKGGCSQEEVISALKLLGVWPEASPNGVQQGRISALERQTAVYEYITADGELKGEKGRFERPDGSKTFLWRRPGESEWKGGIKVAEMPLWGAQLLAGQPETLVVFTEGEKAAQACRDQGLIAVTFGGGASSKDFGDSLNVLAGRDVVLWPDNDPEGRSYMARVHALLRPLARSVRLVMPAVKEKGDAFDYFANGGTWDALIAGAPPVHPTVEFQSEDALIVRIPTPLGVAIFGFTGLEKSSRAFEAELEISIDGPGRSGEPYSQRINLLSSSQRTELRRDLDTMFSKDWGWTGVINTAFAMARRSYLDQEKATVLREIPDPGEVEYLVEDMIPAGASTAFFGDGSAGKTYILLRLGIAVAMGEAIFGLSVQRGPVLFVDYENTASMLKFRVRRLWHGMGHDGDPDLPIYHWPARGIPLPDQIDGLRRFVEEKGITFVIVDAAADACGGEPESAVIATRYFNALDKLGAISTATIAHTTKGGGEDKPFGSVFWHNRPRRTWFIAREQDEDSDVIDVGMYCKKVNDGRKPRPMGLRVTFEGKDGPVRIEPAELTDTPALSMRRPLKFQIRDAIRAGVRTGPEIAAHIDAPYESVRKAMQREARLFKKVGEQSRLQGGHPENVWGLVE